MRRIHRIALSDCIGSSFIEEVERGHRKSKRTESKRRSANSGGTWSERRSNSPTRASARAQKPRSSGKSPPTVVEVAGRLGLGPDSSMACLARVVRSAGKTRRKKNTERRSGG